MLKFFAYLALGKLLIFLGQKFPFQKLPIIGRLFGEGEFLEQLFACDLCLGVWIYFLLALTIRMNILYELTAIPILAEFLTGAIASFLMHIFSVGMKAKFETIIVQ